MKKLTLLLLIVFTVGTFALDVDMNMKGSVGFELDAGGPSDQTQSFGDVRATLKISKGDTNFYWIPKLSSSTLCDYLFADTMTGLGLFRVGLQRIGLANFVAGPYATSTFLLESVQKGSGISLATKIAGMTTRISLLGNMFLVDDGKANGSNNNSSKSSLSVLVNTGMPFGLKVGAVYNNLSTNGAAKNGLSAYAEAQENFAGFNVKAAAFYDLSADAAKSSLFDYLYLASEAAVPGSGMNYTKARQLIQVYADYALPGGILLAGSYTTDLNQAGLIDSEMIAAAKYALTPEVNAWFTYNVTKVSAGASPVLGTDLQTAKMSFEFLVM